MKKIEFTVPRAVVSRIGLEEYLVFFWWAVLPVPLFGLVALSFGNGLAQALGLFALLWPLTLVARSWFATFRTSRLYQQGLTVSIDDHALYFQSQNHPGIRLRFESIRQVVRRHGYLILRLRRLGFMLLPESCLTEDELQRLLAHIATAKETVPLHAEDVRTPS